MTTGPIRLKPEDSAAAGQMEAVEQSALGSGAPRRRWPSWLAPVVALAVALLIFWALVATKSVPEKSDPVIPSPLVRVMTAEPEDLRLTVVARGTVVPRTESDLVAEVRGRVIESSPQLVEGGFFSQGDVLLRLDDREYRIALDRARATVQLRESEARLAVAEARRRRELATRGAASAADLEQFESRELVAKAALHEARAAREQAELDLERTEVRAPFDGRVRERNVDVGQFVAPGAKLGRIFAVDYSEVRLPIQTDELAYLDIDAALDFGEPVGGASGASVVLSARLGGRDLTWVAHIERAEAVIDEQTRMLNLVARIEDPYGRASGSPGRLGAALEDEASDGGAGAAARATAATRRAPLPPGLFVTAEIAGRELENVFVLPPLALRDGDQVFVHDSEGRLRVRDVSVVRRDRTQVVIDGGIEAGEEIVISPLRIHSEGMQLRTLDASDS
jgi:RND family efflux transporter MFP subunit